jgi:Lar family restriction alleviation protein
VKAKETVIKSCPFCDNSKSSLFSLGFDGGLNYVICLKCGANGPTSDTERGAIRKWNGRTK